MVRNRHGGGCRGSQKWNHVQKTYSPAVETGSGLIKASDVGCSAKIVEMIF